MLVHLVGLLLTEPLYTPHCWPEGQEGKTVA